MNWLRSWFTRGKVEVLVEVLVEVPTQWVDFKLRKPEFSHDEVLTYNGRYISLRRFLSYKGTSSGMFFDHLGNKVLGVTHWAPVPRVTKEE